MDLRHSNKMFLVDQSNRPDGGVPFFGDQHALIFPADQFLRRSDGVAEAKIVKAAYLSQSTLSFTMGDGELRILPENAIGSPVEFQIDCSPAHMLVELLDLRFVLLPACGDDGDPSPRSQ